MAGVTVKLDQQHVLDAFDHLGNVAGDLSLAFADVAEYLLQSHHARWKRMEDPDGQRWKELSRAYRKRKPKNKNKILVLEGYLRQMLTYEVGPSELAFGTNRIYGAVHQFGSDENYEAGGVPPRPFLGLTRADENEIIRILADHVAPP